MATKEEILEGIFYKPKTQDWYKPVLIAMDKYANQFKVKQLPGFDVSEYYKDEPSMKWVKASERLPDKNGIYYCKCVHKSEPSVTTKLLFPFEDGGFWSDDGTDIANLEWLDESTEQGRDKPVRDVVELLRGKDAEIERMKAGYQKQIEELEQRLGTRYE